MLHLSTTEVEEMGMEMGMEMGIGMEMEMETEMEMEMETEMDKNQLAHNPQSTIHTHTFSTIHTIRTQLHTEHTRMDRTCTHSTTQYKNTIQEHNTRGLV